MFIRNLLLIPLLFARLLLDGDGAGGDAGGAGAPADGGDAGGKDNTGATPPANGGKPSGAGAAPAGDGSNGTAEGAPAAGRDPVAAANDQAAKARVKAREAEDKLEAFKNAFVPALKAMGIDIPGTDVDPKQLATEVEQWKGKYREERVGNTLQKIATQEGAKAELMLRYLRGGGELAQLDPDSPQFEEQATAMVRAAIASEPTLKAAGSAPTRSGADFSAGASGATRSIEQQLQDAAEKQDWKSYNRLMEEFAAVKERGSGAAVQ